MICEYDCTLILFNENIESTWRTCDWRWLSCGFKAGRAGGWAYCYWHGQHVVIHCSSCSWCSLSASSTLTRSSRFSLLVSLVLSGVVLVVLTTTHLTCQRPLLLLLQSSIALISLLGLCFRLQRAKKLGASGRGKFLYYLFHTMACHVVFVQQLITINLS